MRREIKPSDLFRVSGHCKRGDTLDSINSVLSPTASFLTLNGISLGMSIVTALRPRSCRAVQFPTEIRFEGSVLVSNDLLDPLIVRIEAIRNGPT